jgi:hypothetical protein
MKFEPINYKALNSRQKENFNFQKVSAVLADYGFVTIRLSDDWQGADFIAYHANGETFLKIQLKSRLTVDTKYKNKNIWICFQHKEAWYLFPHDDFLSWALNNLSIGTTNSWKKGGYSWPSLSKDILSWLNKHELKPVKKTA